MEKIKQFLKKGLVIDEKMSGWISLDSPYMGKEAGEQYPFAVHLRAHTSKVFSLTTPREFKGKATFAGWHPDVPIKGIMKISTKGVAYTIELALEDLGPITIEGEKIYRLDELVYTLTTCPLVVRNSNQEKIGSAELVYRDPLWFFPFGLELADTKDDAFRPNWSHAQKLVSLANIITPHVFSYVNSDQLARELEWQLSKRPKILRKFIALLAFIIQARSYLFYRKGIEKLSPAQREKLALKLGKVSIYHFLTLPLIDLILVAAYGNKQYLEAKGANIPVPPKENEPERWMELNFTPKVQFSKSPLEVEVVVIGSGAGGAAVAYELSKRGHAVAVVEEGRYFKRTDFSGNRAEMQSKLYRMKGFQFPLSNSPIWLPTGKCVGGTTTINSGTCIRTPSSVVERWKNDLGLDISLDKYFPDVERVLNVTEAPEKLLGGVASIMKKGLDGSNFQFEPLLRAEAGCDGQSYCTIGCPTGAKKSTDISFMPEAMKQNTFLFSQYRVKKVIVENGKARGIVAELPGFGPEFDLTIHAQVVIISAGTLKTPEIIMKNGLSTGLQHLGQHLTIHPALCLGAIFNEKVREKFYVPQSSGVFNVGDENFVLEGYTLPIDAIPHAFGYLGAHLDEIMEDIECFTNFASMLKDTTEGNLFFLPNGMAVPSYFLNRKTIETLKKSAIMMSEIFFKGGARRVFTPIQGFEKLTNEIDIERLEKSKLHPWQIKLSAHHPLGTCRMGSTPENSVVNEYGKLWNTENLFVCDGSIIPGPLGVNPQVTIMSNALRIGEYISTQVLS